MSSKYCDKTSVCVSSSWCADDFDPKGKCDYFAVKTNYDVIHNMTPEELAVMFAKLRVRPYLLDRPVQPYQGRDVNDWYDWLRQEVEA